MPRPLFLAALLPAAAPAADLDVGLLQPDDALRADVSGLPPGALTYLFASPRGPGAGPCAPGRPVCVGLLAPRILAAVRADASGTATFVVPTPAVVPPHAWLQAVAPGPAVVTPVVERLAGDPDGFPRLAGQWLFDDGTLGAFEIARYRTIVEGGAVAAAAAREGTTRPGLKARLAAMDAPTRVLATGFGPDFNNDPAYRPVDATARPELFLGTAAGHLYTHWPNPPLYALNVVLPAVRAEGIAWNQASLAAVGPLAPPAARWADGLFVDSLEPWGSYFCCDGANPVDVDRDGVDEPYEVFLAAWPLGVARYADELRAAMGPDPVLLVNGSGVHHARALVWHHASGAIDEHGLNEVFERSDADWRALVQSLAARGDVLDDPHGVIVAMEATGGSGPPDVPPTTQAQIDAARTNWRRMRFGLGTALLAGQTYLYDWGASLHGFPWWYDPYGGRPGLPVGWLGAPTGPATPATLPPTPSVVPDDATLSTAAAWGGWCLGGSGPVLGTSPDATRGGGSLSVAVTHPPAGDDGWVSSCNVSTHAGFPVTQGETLTVLFDARATTTVDGRPAAGRLVQPQVQALFADWALVGDSPPVLVTPTWRRYVARIPITRDHGSARLDFGLTNADGTVFLDDVVVLRGAPSDVWSRPFEGGHVLVNASGLPVDVAVPPGLRRLRGTQDPAVDTGAPVGPTVTVPAWDAVLLRR